MARHVESVLKKQRNAPFELMSEHNLNVSDSTAMYLLESVNLQDFYLTGVVGLNNKQNYGLPNKLNNTCFRKWLVVENRLVYSELVGFKKFTTEFALKQVKLIAERKRAKKKVVSN